MDYSQRASDKAMMARCIELSRIALSKGEYPFGTVIAMEGQVVVEAINSTIRDGDVTRHAEVIALSQAQKTIGRKQLFRSTPIPISSRARCAPIAFARPRSAGWPMPSALQSMGGLSKWNILRDEDVSAAYRRFLVPCRRS